VTHVLLIRVLRQTVKVLFCVFDVIKDVENFYDIRNQLVTCIDAEAKAKNAAFAASITTTPPAEQRSGLRLRFLLYFRFLCLCHPSVSAKSQCF